MEDGRGVQGFRIHLVAIVTQPNDDRVGMEYDLHILRLPDVAVGSLDGERDEVVPAVWCEPERDFVLFELVASFIYVTPRLALSCDVRSSLSSS